MHVLEMIQNRIQVCMCNYSTVKRGNNAPADAITRSWKFSRFAFSQVLPIRRFWNEQFLQNIFMSIDWPVFGSFVEVAYSFLGSTSA